LQKRVPIVVLRRTAQAEVQAELYKQKEVAVDLKLQREAEIYRQEAAACEARIAACEEHIASITKKQQRRQLVSNLLTFHAADLF